MKKVVILVVVLLLGMSHLAIADNDGGDKCINRDVIGSIKMNRLVG